MNTKQHFNTPQKPTPHGLEILRARASLQETQEQFAKRFHVSVRTISNWETGRTRYMHKVYKVILGKITANLVAEKMLLLVPEDRDGNLLQLNQFYQSV